MLGHLRMFPRNLTINPVTSRPVTVITIQLVSKKQDFVKISKNILRFPIQ
jgi:hypothetical protein